MASMLAIIRIKYLFIRDKRTAGSMPTGVQHRALPCVLTPGIDALCQCREAFLNRMTRTLARR